MAKKRGLTPEQARQIAARLGDTAPSVRVPAAGRGNSAIPTTVSNKTPQARSATPEPPKARSAKPRATPSPKPAPSTKHWPEGFHPKPIELPRVEDHIKRPAVDVHIPAARRMSTGSKIGLGVAGAGTLAAGGYAIHRARSRKKVVMAKTLINPYEEVVVFGKAVALPVPSAVRIRTPNLNSGSHRGNALALVRIRNARGGGGPATALEHYTTSPKGGRQGPFGHKGNSKIPDGARRGRRIA